MTVPSAVATDIMGVSGRAMVEALMARTAQSRGARRAGAGPDEAKHSALLAALDGRFDDHHAELARMLLDQIDALTTQIDALSAPHR